jgi:hypothetical protein
VLVLRAQRAIIMRDNQARKDETRLRSGVYAHVTRHLRQIVAFSNSPAKLVCCVESLHYPTRVNRNQS